MCVCVCVYMYINVYLYMYIYIKNVFINVYLYICIFISKFSHFCSPISFLSYVIMFENYGTVFSFVFIEFTSKVIDVCAVFLLRDKALFNTNYKK